MPFLGQTCPPWSLSPGCTLLVPVTGGLFWGSTSHLPAQPPLSGHQVPSPPPSTCLHVCLDQHGVPHRHHGPSPCLSPTPWEVG